MPQLRKKMAACCTYHCWIQGGSTIRSITDYNAENRDTTPEQVLHFQKILTDPLDHYCFYHFSIGNIALKRCPLSAIQRPPHRLSQFPLRNGFHKKLGNTCLFYRLGRYRLTVTL